MIGYNPSIRQELRYEAIKVIPPREIESLLDWLKRTGRLKSRAEIEAPLADEILETLDEMIDLANYSLAEEE